MACIECCNACMYAMREMAFTSCYCFFLWLVVTGVVGGGGGVVGPCVDFCI